MYIHVQIYFLSLQRAFLYLHPENLHLQIYLYFGIVHAMSCFFSDCKQTQFIGLWVCRDLYFGLRYMFAL